MTRVSVPGRGRVRRDPDGVTVVVTSHGPAGLEEYKHTHDRPVPGMGLTYRSKRGRVDFTPFLSGPHGRSGPSHPHSTRHDTGASGFDSGTGEHGGSHRHTPLL